MEQDTAEPPPTILTGEPRPFSASAVVMAAVLALFVLAACGSGDDESVDDLPFAESEGEDGTSAPVDGAGENDVGRSTTPTTAGSGLPPVTTIVGWPGGDPDNIYAGRLGRLGLSEMVVTPAVPPPTVEPGVLPLTGIRAADAIGDEVPDRAAAVVKIDNGPAAYPQTGLNAADIVIEEEVEGGVTRFAAVFHSRPSIVGPVRSARTTDISLISSLGDPLLMYSGANDITEMILRRQPRIQNRSFGTSSGYWRDEQRRAPSNLYTDTAPHWASAFGGPPPPQFAYRDDGEPAKGESVNEFAIDYAASPASWQWTGQEWIRYQRGQRHELDTGEPVTAVNVVVIEADRVGTGMVDASGGQVPEFVYVGTGPATVYTDGVRLDGIWTRPSLDSVATLTTTDDDVIELTPGRTWVQLIEVNAGLLR